MGLTLEDLRRDFSEYMIAPDLPAPSWNIAPTQDILILLEDHRQPGTRRAERARWSLTPPWSSTLETKYPTFNARTEGITEKAAWKGPLVARRCAIVTTGFYEWSGPKGQRHPHFITGPHNTLLMAGLYGWWRPREDPHAWHLTATMLTQASVGTMTSLHDRMPVFVDDTLLGEWLNPAIHGTQDLVDVLVAESAGIATRLTEHRVPPLRGDGPHLVEPISATLGTLEDRGE